MVISTLLGQWVDIFIPKAVYYKQERNLSRQWVALVWWEISHLPFIQLFLFDFRLQKDILPSLVNLGVIAPPSSQPINIPGCLRTNSVVGGFFWLAGYFLFQWDGAVFAVGWDCICPSDRAVITRQIELYLAIR